MSGVHLLYDGMMKLAQKKGESIRGLLELQALHYNAGRGNLAHQQEWTRRQAALSNW